MKRIPISLKYFLEDFLAGVELSESESGKLHQLTKRPGGPTAGEIRALLEGLLDRQVLERIEFIESGSHEIWILRDPRRRARARIRLPRQPELPDFERISLPLDDSFAQTFRLPQVHRLLSLEGGLVSHDRVTTPRELGSRLRRLLQDMIPSAELRLHSVQMPAEDAWPPFESTRLPHDADHLRRLARERDELLVWRKTPEGGSRLVLGVGDSTTGWHGLLELQGTQTGLFGREQIALAALIGQYFQNLMNAVIRLQGLIFYDFLTGIYNRAYYEEQVEREVRLARRRNQSMALLIADIDSFKEFNTRYGYDGGDRTLATVACVLKAALRGTDTLARYGGEEFAIILAPPVPRDEAELIAERLRSAVELEPFTLSDLAGNQVQQRITVSIGGVLFPTDGSTPRELWNAANRLVLEAKARGKNQVCFGSADPSRSLGS